LRGEIERLAKSAAERTVLEDSARERSGPARICMVSAAAFTLESGYAEAVPAGHLEAQPWDACFCL